MANQYGAGTEDAPKRALHAQVISDRPLGIDSGSARPGTSPMPEGVVSCALREVRGQIENLEMALDSLYGRISPCLGSGQPPNTKDGRTELRVPSASPLHDDIDGIARRICNVAAAVRSITERVTL